MGRKTSPTASQPFRDRRSGSQTRTVRIRPNQTPWQTFKLNNRLQSVDQSTQGNRVRSFYYDKTNCRMNTLDSSGKTQLVRDQQLIDWGNYLPGHRSSYAIFRLFFVRPQLETKYIKQRSLVPALFRNYELESCPQSEPHHQMMFIAVSTPHSFTC